MFLDVTPDLLAQGDVLGHGSLDDLIKGLDIHGHSSRGDKNKASTFTHRLQQLLNLHPAMRAENGRTPDCSTTVHHQRSLFASGQSGPVGSLCFLSFYCSFFQLLTLPDL